MNITQEMLDNLRADLKDAFRAIEQKYDLKFDGININYGDVDFEMKVTAERTDVNAGEYRLNEFAAVNGYDYLYDKHLIIQGHQIVLKDYDPKARKWKIIAEDKTAGKLVKLSLDAISGFKIVGHVRID